MGIQINNNTAAFNVWSSYSSNVDMMNKSMSNLSTGVKSSAEDPSGVGISEKMRSQARNVAMARNNVDNSISLIQTGDSWLQKINDMLARMSELAIEANDGTKTKEDKANVSIEFAALQDEITRITSKSTSAAKYNGLYLFRGGNGIAVAAGDSVDSGNIRVQIGSDNGQTIDLSLVNLSDSNSTAIGTVISYTYGSTGAVSTTSSVQVKWNSVINKDTLSVGSTDVIGKLAKAIDFISNNRALLGSQQNRLEQTRSALLGYEDNLRAAESKIRDVDMASETTKFTKFQILSQVGNAMLAQANQLPSQIVQLVG